MGKQAYGQPPDEIERELIRRIARKFHAVERADLEAELAMKLMQIKSRGRPYVGSWQAYVQKALFNHAINLVREQSRTQKGKVPLREWDDEDSTGKPTQGIVLSSCDPEFDLQIALAEAVQELRPTLRRLWEVLKEENGNQLVAAKRLRVHRNTIRNWLQEIRRIFERHGLP